MAPLRVSAHDAKTGKGLWRTDLVTKLEKPEVGFGGGLAFDGGQLFVATGFGDVFALNPAVTCVVNAVKFLPVGYTWLEGVRRQAADGGSPSAILDGFRNLLLPLGTTLA